MNIYNKLFVLEYTKIPKTYTDDICLLKCWSLNYSKNKYRQLHRNFDLPSFMDGEYKIWRVYNQLHRLIGPASISVNLYKEYYIRDRRVVYR